MAEIDGKSCCSIKKLISTSERHAEHPFAGQNTQHMSRLICMPDKLKYYGTSGHRFDGLSI